MNKYLFFLFISLSLSCQTPQEVKHTDASPLNIVHYEPSNEAIINPERGFLTHQDQKSDADKLTTEKVKNYRQQGISLILTIYYMQPFRQRLLSEEFLHLIRRNMKAVREGGAKVVLRFAYTDSEAQKPLGRPNGIQYFSGAKFRVETSSFPSSHTRLRQLADFPSLIIRSSFGDPSV